LPEKSNGHIVFFIMGYKAELVAPPQIEQAILLIRGQRVMLDRDLAAIYGVSTGNLNKAVRRNLFRFPADFMFQLTADEAEASRFQIGILDKGLHFKYLPCFFSGVSVHTRPHPGPLPRGEGAPSRRRTISRSSSSSPILCYLP
jgi:hypothetical protein